MLSKQVLFAAVLGAFSFAGCVGSTVEEDSVELTNAKISQVGESLVATGLVDGVETSVVASDVTVDGDSDISDETTSCYLCRCEGSWWNCPCKKVPCP
jgi:hypothetical protein